MKVSGIETRIQAEIVLVARENPACRWAAAEIPWLPDGEEVLRALSLPRMRYRIARELRLVADDMTIRAARYVHPRCAPVLRVEARLR